MRNPGVDLIVVRPGRTDLLCGQTVDPAPEREGHPLQPGFGLGVHPAGDDDRHEVGAVLRHGRQVRAIGAKQPA